ncbi:AMP-binding protein [Desulforhopalus singaporensis]|uniref:Long-chain acyl-CoA synthetase n=1 Tax=Desulforhopalus singaporensis TaxID=91360 RepID=A0A1H0LCL6_9BACT|nr:AMP-binding protein [Desulforhopalus singaporensis]SDO65741.1 long-chain acyl-CoA synthetase [Desulforhopalus singaporensis]
MGLYDFSFYDLINRNAAVYEQRLCWKEVDDGRELTFGEFKKQVDSLAAGLSDLGVGPGDRIGVVGKNSLEFFLVYGGAAAVGAIVVPVNWRLSPDEVYYNLNDCSPRIVFVDEEFQATVDARKAGLGSAVAYCNLKGDAGGEKSFQSLLTTPRAQPGGGAKSSDGFVIIHTAAVAGYPRGALVSHANIMSADVHFLYYMGITSSDVHLNLLPLFHVGGLFLAITTFHAGGLNLNISKFDASLAAGLIERYKVTHFFDFPPILDSILQAAAEDNCDIGSLRAVVGLGTAETITRFQQRTGGSYYCMYGQTETSCLATMGRYDDCPGSAGKTIMLADVRLVDDYENPVAPGAVGEIAVKGPMVFQGYWNLPDDNAYTFRDGWHHTGDLGRFNEDGFLFYAGRKAEKELIKPGGENVYPAEVEKIILQHPAVAATVVIGVPDPKWKEGIKAVCQLHPGKTLGGKELIDFVGGRIARFKKPQYVEFVQALPLKEDGSIDRNKVKAEYGGNS